MQPGEHAVQRWPRRSAGDLWAYAYLVVPPQPGNRLEAIRMILEQENVAARAAPHIWTGRLIREERITQILIVSDSPVQNGAVNRRLEAELMQMKAAFFLTEPMAIPAPGLSP